MVQGPNDLPKIPTSPAIKPLAPAPVSKLKSELPAPIPRPDSVELSPRAVQVAQLFSRLQAQAEVDTGRVEEVKAKLGALVANTASLNAKIAEKLLTEN
jgi:hypothetical protein